MAGNKKVKKEKEVVLPKRKANPVQDLYVGTKVKTEYIKTPEEFKAANQKLMLEPFVSVTLLQNNRATELDWRTVQFRLYVGEALIDVYEAHYTGLDVAGMKQASQDAILALNASAQRFKGGHLKNPTLTSGEAELIKEALHDTDDLHNALDRTVVLHVYRFVENMLKENGAA